eukprot:Protomagalhaensia_sp_Gyna_25__5179@NODE_616_length_3005_cov_104_418409_g477_i0_p2_GENE_NODE_616_length_3005_cov_104_418409_g477_i0NODE_616_length_3005_cov_104_418409_g477_i0_p2_ORF_typecomplete_len225_score62_08Gly_kinase/PF02595_15/0_006LKAAEAR/PF15478_6/0_16LKAAEAR/PF15478_6/2_7e03LKAAEAR/PF15478_6/2_4e03FTO_CTD/PF12934_7/2_3e02FTO_CTD/PF12934_7/7_1FTO_CTD/PF12934_7/26SHE3/PF17078_5/1_7SHE3/PF17078_5/68_NODE_616_length_3005_cov_104_418409_g477_i064738
MARSGDLKEGGDGLHNQVAALMAEASHHQKVANELLKESEIILAMTPKQRQAFVELYSSCNLSLFPKLDAARARERVDTTTLYEARLVKQQLDLIVATRGMAIKASESLKLKRSKLLDAVANTARQRDTCLNEWKRQCRESQILNGLGSRFDAIEESLRRVLASLDSVYQPAPDDAAWNAFEKRVHRRNQIEEEWHRQRHLSGTLKLLPTFQFNSKDFDPIPAL